MSEWTNILSLFCDIVFVHLSICPSVCECLLIQIIKRVRNILRSLTTHSRLLPENTEHHQTDRTPHLTTTTLWRYHSCGMQNRQLRQRHHTLPIKQSFGSHGQQNGYFWCGSWKWWSGGHDDEACWHWGARGVGIDLKSCSHPRYWLWIRVANFDSNNKIKPTSR